MPFSEHSLLLAIVFTDAAIIILLTTTWLSSGIEPFLRTWLVGIVISLVGTFASAVFYMNPELWVGAISFGALAIGFSVNALASFQFRTDHLPLRALRTHHSGRSVGNSRCDAVGLYRAFAHHLAGLGGSLRGGRGGKLLDGPGRSAGGSDYPRAFLPCPGDPIRLVFGHPHSRRQHVRPAARQLGGRGVAPRRPPDEARQRRYPSHAQPLAGRQPRSRQPADRFPAT